MTSEVQVLAVGLVCAVGVGALGLGAAQLARRRSLRWQLMVLVLTTGLAVLAGSAALAAQGFLTGRPMSGDAAERLPLRAPPH